MRKFKAIALGVASVFVLAAAPVAFVGASQGNPQGEPATKLDANGITSAVAAVCNPRMSASNSAGQELFLSTSDPRTYTGTSWQNVDCTTTTFRVPFGQRALVTSDFNAEADCNGTSPTNGQWCETRALLNGLEGRPVAAEPSSFAFDGVAGGVNNWQAHSMERAWETPRCAATAGCQYRFVVQTKMHNTTVTGMWLDEVAVDLNVTYGPQAAF
jgi:hypothetical protein